MKLFTEAVCGSEDLGAAKGTIQVVYTTAMWCMPDTAHHATVRHKGAIRKAIYIDLEIIIRMSVYHELYKRSSRVCTISASYLMALYIYLFCLLIA